MEGVGHENQKSWTVEVSQSGRKAFMDGGGIRGSESPPALMVVPLGRHLDQVRSTTDRVSRAVLRGFM